MSDWSITTDRLTSRRRTGGRTALGGFEYQEAYACLCLAKLLDSSGDLISIRYEGAQDVDLLYADGREQYVQLKNEPSKNYTLAALRPILQNFATDLLEAGWATPLMFEIVARSNSVDAAVARLQASEPSTFDSDVTAVATELIVSPPSSPAPDSIKALPPEQLSGLVRLLLRRTTFSFGAGEEVDGQRSFESRACVVLAGNGVANKDLLKAVDCLKAALKSQSTYRRADIQEILKGFIGDAAVESIFNGGVEILNDRLLAPSADAERVKDFYAGAPLKWDIIAADGDIERDQQEELIQRLSQPSENLRMFVLEAEPGAGKSTLARRIAVELHRRHGALVIRVKPGVDAATWYSMQEFYDKVKRPFYVVVDDLFRASEVIDVVRELNTSLPITILATTRANEYPRHHRLSCEPERIPVKRPSFKEKELFLKRLGKTRAELTPKQQKLLDTDSPFLVLMLEVAAGKKLEEIVADTLTRLQKNSESTYRAYEYLCFAYKHGVAFSESLLKNLDPEGRFYNLPARLEAQKLIFNDEDRTELLRVGHPIIAQTSADIYKQNRAPAAVLGEIVNAVDSSNPFERRFVAHLLRAEAQANSDALQQSLSSIKSAIERYQQASDQIGEMKIWLSFYRRLGKEEEVRRCEEIGLALTPETTFDCDLLLSIYRKRRREWDALPVIVEWVRTHRDSHGSISHLYLIEKYGTPKERAAAILETGEWLRRHPEDSNVREFYLGFVARKGTPEQVADVLQETNVWLAKQPDNVNVRVVYLGLLEEKILNKSSQTAAQVINEVSAWLKQHPDDAYVRAYYLGLVKRWGTLQKVEIVLAETEKWLQSHYSAKEVWKAFIAVLIRAGKIEDAAVCTAKAISFHPKDQNLTSQYLRLFQNSVGADSVKKLYEKLIQDYPKDSNIPTHFAAWLRDNNLPDESASLYQWLTKRYPRNYKAHYGFGRLLLSIAKFSEAAEQFRATLRLRSRHAWAHQGLAQSLRGLGNTFEQKGNISQAYQLFMEAWQEFNLAIRCAGESRKPQCAFYNSLGGFYLERRVYERALNAFNSAKDEDPEFFETYWGLGRAFFEQKRFPEAVEALRIALEKAPEDFQPPASDEIPELLSLCRTALKQVASTES